MAMIDLGKLGFDLVLNKKGWNESFDGANEDIEKNESKWKSFAGNIGGKIKTGITGAVVGIGAAVGGMAVAGIKNVAELDDHMAKFSAHTGMTGEEANKVKQTVMDLYKANEDSYEDIAKTAEALSTAMGMNADDIKKYAQNYMNYAKVTGQANDEAVGAIDDLGDAWALNSDEAVLAMDKLLVLSQDYGMSVEDAQAGLTKMAPAAKAVGMSMDEATGYMAMFAQTGIDAQTASTAFSKALQKVKSPEELKKLTKDITDCEDPMKRAQMASEIFGAKAGPQMAQALGESDLDIEKFIKSMGETEGAVNKASDSYDKSLKVQLNLLKKQFMGLFTELGEKLSPLIEKFVGWLQENMPIIQEILTKLFESVGYLLEITIGNVSKLLQAFIDWFNGSSEGATEFKEFLSSVFDSIKQIMDGLKTFVGEALKAIKEFWKNNGEQIKAIVVPIWNSIKIIIKTALDIIKNIIKVGTGIIKGDWGQVWEGVKGIFKSAWEGMKKLLPNLLKGLVEVIKGAAKLFFGAGKAIFKGVWEGMKNIWRDLTGWVGKKVEWLKDKLMFWRKGKNEMSDSGGYNGSHYNGLDCVPYDGYIARLHQGERVLTKEENKALTNGDLGGNGGINITIDKFINDRKQSVQSFAEEFEFYKKQYNLSRGGAY